MSITSVTTLDGHIIDVADLSEREKLYCLAIASNDATHYDGTSAFDCLIGRAGTSILSDEDELPVDAVIDQFPDILEEVLAIYDGVAHPPYDHDSEAALAFAARVLDITGDRVEHLRSRVMGDKT